MNLGNFAGGAVQGYQSQERLELAKREAADNQVLQQRRMNLSEQEGAIQQRRLSMAEQDQAHQNAQRARADALRKESETLFKQFYGERQEQVGETEGDDGNGGVTKIPTIKSKLIQPGADPDIDRQWYAGFLQLQAKHGSLEPTHVEAMTKRLEEVRRTKTGQLLDKVAMGDKGSLGELLKSLGKDSEGAKLDWRPVDGVNQIVLQNGEKLDLKKYAAANATVAHYQQMLQEEKGAREGAVAKGNLDESAAGSALKKAQASLIPSQIRENEAGANAKNAQAAHAGEARQSLREERASAAAQRELKTVSTILEKNFPSSKEPDGTIRVHPARGYVEQAVLDAKPGMERKAAVDAMKRADAVSSEAQARVRALSPETLKNYLKQIKGSSPADLVDFYTQAGLRAQ